ncbi:DUF4232 domain-containing protein [Streptomyces liangshanensis]|uniref:DUF4232 domain-containing protein n=1 Tax=Streptomyces liangshanensis TaxID=2717324 RepID=UPI0036DD6D83
MISRLAKGSSRYTRLAMGAVAIAALTATLTACGPEETGAVVDSSPTAKQTASGAAGKDNDVDGAKDDYYGDDSGADAGKDNDVDGAKDDYYGDNSGTDAGKDNDVDGAKQDHFAKKCDNGDLNFTAATFSEGSGYHLITAKAKPGVTCILQGPPQQVMFGSDPDTVAADIDQGTGESIKLKGSTAAYLAVQPRSTGLNEGKAFETLVISVSDDADEAGVLRFSGDEALPVSKPLVTPWQPTADAAAHPFA